MSVLGFIMRWFNPSRAHLESPRTPDVPNLIPDDQTRKVAERLEKTRELLQEGERIRNHSRSVSLQFGEQLRETATGILGADLMADRAKRIPERRG